MTTTARQFHLENQYLTDDDHMYHLGLLTSDEVIERMKDIKFVCLGGKPKRMERFAGLLYKVLGEPVNSEFDLEKSNGVKRIKDLSGHAGRYSLFKVGNCLCASHGIGMPSLSVVLHEILKLIHFAKCSDVKIFRLGTSGGIGIEPGTIVLTRKGYSGALEPYFTQTACGKKIQYSAETDEELTEDLHKFIQDKGMKVQIGNTVATNDFYEEQARLDGSLCSYTKEEKELFLRKAHEEYGVLNFEMESNLLSAYCRRANIKCAIMCVTVVNRLISDNVTSDVEQIKEWEGDLLKVAAGFIKSRSNGFVSSHNG